MGIFKLLNCISWLIIPMVQLYTGNCLLQLPGCCRSVVPLHQRAQSLNPKAVVKILLGVLKAARAVLTACFHVPFYNVPWRGRDDPLCCPQDREIPTWLSCDVAQKVVLPWVILEWSTFHVCTETRTMEQGKDRAQPAASGMLGFPATGSRNNFLGPKCC